MAPESERAMWLVWSAEHQLWWRPNSQGYTDDVKQAGRYTFDKALSICDTRNSGNMYPKAVRQGVPVEIPVPAPEYFDRIRELDAPKEPTLTCSDCGHPKDDSRYHLDAPGTNWGAALHWYVAPAPCPLNESNRTQFESGCSEVVERLATLLKVCVGAGYDPTPGVEKCVLSINESRFRTHAGAILHSWRERRVQELEAALELCMSVIWSEFHTGPTDDMTGDNEADIAYRAGKKALGWREQIGKGAKHEL